MTEKTDFYKQSGVDIAQGDKFSKFAAQICRNTYGNSPFVIVTDFSQGNFRGPRGFELDYQNRPELRGAKLTIAPDGEGTKSILTVAAQTFRESARNVVAMVGGDITRWGGVRLVFSNVLDTSTLGEENDPRNNSFKDLLRGLFEVAFEQELVVLNGETAELSVRVSSENLDASLKFNWSGFMVGAFRSDRMILGQNLREGQLLIALADDTLGSNGISAARGAFRKAYGEKYWDNPAARADLRSAARGCPIYDKLFEETNGWHGNHPIPISVIVHATGGAIKSKFAEDMLFPLGLSAELTDLFEPPEIMTKCKEWAEVDDEKAYEIWHGGQRALVAMEENYANHFISLATVHGKKAKICSMVTKNPTPQVRIVSKFGSGREIIYKAV